MIVPDVRGSFGRNEAKLVIWLLTGGEEQEWQRQEERLNQEGFDALLDDPRTFNTLMSGRPFSDVPASLVFYLLARHALLEEGIADRVLADYMAALLLAFGHGARAYHPEQQEAEFHYLVDIVAAARQSSGSRAFQLRVHMGEYALWLSGLFPDHISARVRRRGAPGIAYYEELGSSGYWMAAQYREAQTRGLALVYRHCAESFPRLRVALNHIADRHLFPATGDRIERLLRQVADSFPSSHSGSA